MGTRHLIMVQQDNGIKVAQYGQWDGYPEGQGAALLLFCRHHLNDLIKALPKVTYLTDAEHNAFVKDMHNKVTKALIYNHNFISRDLSVNVLHSIIESDLNIIKLYNDFAFGYDSLMCEWAYCINLDTRQLEVYKGFNETPLNITERFYMSTPIYTDRSEDYYGVKLLTTFDLDNLPTEETFINTIRSLENEKTM